MGWAHTRGWQWSTGRENEATESPLKERGALTPFRGSSVQGREVLKNSDCKNQRGFWPSW